MERDATERRRDQVVIAVGLYLFVSVTAGLYTFMRAFEFTGCSGQCDITAMANARVLFLNVDIWMLVLVLSTMLVLALCRRPVLWLATCACIGISALAITSNVVFTAARTTGTG